MNLKPAPVTPLRRSERLRRPTSKAIGSSPSSSPGTTAYVSRSINTRPRVFYAPRGQTDSDSTLRNTSSSQSSGSSEDTVGDATDCMALAASFPPKVYETYQGLAPLLRHSDADFMRRDVPCLIGYLNEINAFLLKIIAIGQSCIWTEFKNFMQLCKRIAEVIKAKSAIPPPGMGDGLQFSVGPTHVAMKAEHWQEAWGEQADTGYIQGLYKNAAPPSNFGWDDVGAGGSEVQSEETNALLHESLSYPYPPNKSVDYWTIPDSY